VLKYANGNFYEGAWLNNRRHGDSHTHTLPALYLPTPYLPTLYLPSTRAPGSTTVAMVIHTHTLPALYLPTPYLPTPYQLSTYLLPPTPSL